MSDDEYVCDECGESFESPAALGGHKTSHPVPGGYSCDVCGSEFDKLASLAAHKTSHPDPDGYACDICGREFDKLASLASHKTHHGDGVDTDFSDESILEEIRELADDLGRAPSKREFRRRTPHSDQTPANRFGSWSDAVREAGLEPVQEREIPKEKFLEAIQDLAEELDRPPTSPEMDELGAYDSTAYRTKFDTWSDALEAAGFESRDKHPVGEDHPQWNGGDFQYGRGWNEAKRELVRERDDRQCSDCGMSGDAHRQKYGRKLDVHHITPARTFSDGRERNDPENLVTLCIPCHRKWEQMAPLRPAND